MSLEWLEQELEIEERLEIQPNYYTLEVDSETYDKVFYVKLNRENIFSLYLSPRKNNCRSFIQTYLEQSKYRWRGSIRFTAVGGQLAVHFPDIQVTVDRKGSRYFCTFML